MRSGRRLTRSVLPFLTTKNWRNCIWEVNRGTVLPCNLWRRTRRGIYPLRVFFWKEASHKTRLYLKSYSSDPEANAEKARIYSHMAVPQRFIPVTPHFFFPQFMNNTYPAEQELAMQMNLQLLLSCPEVWVFGHLPQHRHRKRNQGSHPAWHSHPLIFKGDLIHVRNKKKH